MSAGDNDFTLTRRFAASRSALYDAFTVPDQFAKWFTPKGFKGRFAHVDARVGGGMHYCNTAPDGTEVWGRSTYRELVRPSRIVYLQWFSDAAGGVTVHPLAPTFPTHLLTTLEFTEDGPAASTLHLRWTPYEATPEQLATFLAARGSMTGGWGGTFDNLDAFLS